MFLLQPESSRLGANLPMREEIGPLVVFLALVKERSRQRPAESHGECAGEEGQAMTMAFPKCRKQDAKWLRHMFNARPIMG
jgi:hypothetical protein